MSIPATMILLALTGAPETVGFEVLTDGALILGEVDEVRVQIRAEETREAAGRPLRLSVNVGEFGEVQRVEAGVYQATFTLPATRFPQVALVAVWRETGPNAPISFFPIPLHGKTTLPVRTKSASTVRVLVEDQVFGPAVADRRGRVSIPIVVPPGVEEVVATSTRGKSQSQVTVATGVPPYNRLTLAVTPYLIAADGESSATIHVYYDTQRTPPPIRDIRLDAPSGKLTPLERTGQSYKFRFVPDRRSDQTPIELGVRVRGDRVSKASATLRLGTPTPEKVGFLTMKTPVVADGKSEASLELVVLDRLGLGVEGLTLTATSARLSVLGVSESEAGRYSIALVGPSDYPEDGREELAIEIARAGQEPLFAKHQLAVLPGDWPTAAEFATQPERPTLDSEQPFTLKISAVDAAGRPKPGARLSLRTTSGQASSIEELGDGEYRVEIRPGDDDLIGVEVVDDTGHLKAMHAIELRDQPKSFYFGIGGGLAYYSGLSPAAKIELGLRPGWLDRRLALFFTGGFRLASKSFQLPPELVTPDRSRINATLQVVPLSLGASYDLLVGDDWSVYAGGAFVLAGYQHRLERALSDTSIERGLAPGGELSFGASYYGFFAQIDGSLVPISTDEVEAPIFSIGLLLGYRTGVF